MNERLALARAAFPPVQRLFGAAAVALLLALLVLLALLLYFPAPHTPDRHDADPVPATGAEPGR